MVDSKVEDQDGLDVWKKAIENVTPSVEEEVEELVVRHSKSQHQLEKGEKPH